ncbi:hypothetical protein [Limnofasciculus baicalensis]|uniref:Uncharacterized protein n=1 Tax=Limnofasciculus baicalensis BBK-W-15 TaxID=2699891 RepID=A0AAE3GWP3_9CYAN|nr:hypothetical protein [Limnofasciculus baicalensis]MCP2732080.1 hypothetical protein [Limnofasciculus baicalensis BBK-W-15]
MNTVTLNDRKIWEDIDNILVSIELNHIVSRHLESCNYKIHGYWDSKNNFYEEIAISNPICTELTSRSIGTTLIDNYPTSHWIQLKFLLKADLSALENDLLTDEEDGEIGELTLILDTNLKVVDENWLLDVESPFVVARSHIK